MEKHESPWLLEDVQSNFPVGLGEVQSNFQAGWERRGVLWSWKSTLEEVQSNFPVGLEEVQSNFPVVPHGC